MGSPNEMDYGGLTFVVKDIKVNATAPGQAGTSLSAAELSFVDGVTAGTATASKALVVDSNKDLATIRNLTENGTFTRSGATGVNINALTDNLADALSYKEGSNSYLTFVTTDTAEAINSSQRLTTTDGVASGTAKVVGGRAFCGVSASDTVTAVTSNTAFVAFASTYAIPANTIKAGTVVRARAHVVTNDVSGTDTLTCELRIGGTSLIATTAVDPGATTDHHVLEFNFIGRAAPGATASCTGYGLWATNTGGTVVMKPGILAPTNFATNGALTLDVRAKWSSNTASTSARLESLVVEIL